MKNSRNLSFFLSFCLFFCFVVCVYPRVWFGLFGVCMCFEMVRARGTRWRSGWLEPRQDGDNGDMEAFNIQVRVLFCALRVLDEVHFASKTGSRTQKNKTQIKMKSVEKKIN